MGRSGDGESCTIECVYPSTQRSGAETSKARQYITNITHKNRRMVFGWVSMAILYQEDLGGNVIEMIYISDHSADRNTLYGFR